MKKLIPVLFTWVVTWRADYWQPRACDPVIDPWTGEPAMMQPTIQCGEMRFKHLVRAFDTKEQADGFIATKPASAPRVSDLHIFENSNPKERSK